MNSQLRRVSILSGLIWGLIPALVGALWTASRLHMRSLVLGGLAGVLVGLTTGLLLDRMPRRRMEPLALTAGITLLVTTIVFSVLMTMATEMLTVGEVHSPPSTPMQRILQAPLYWLYGLVASGAVLFLWPLAFLNHIWFFKVREAQDRQFIGIRPLDDRQIP